MQHENVGPIPQIINEEGFFLIPHSLLETYRRNFVDRHELLSKEFPQFVFKLDYPPIVVNIKVLKNLIDGAETNDYLVAQYIVNDDLTKMDIALCIKRKRLGTEADDLLLGNMYDSGGNKLDYCGTFLPGFVNYLKRRTSIFHASRSSISAARRYDFDREGRAHKINDRMRKIIDNLAASNTDLLAYFILEDHNSPGINQLSVAFSDTRIEEGHNSKATKDDAYDHGTACCPIG